MRNQVLFAALFLGALSPAWPAFAGGAPVPATSSKITAATIYADRAVVRRTAELTVVEGIREIRFEQLPAILVDQSIQVTGSGSADAAVVDVAASQTFVAAVPNGTIQSIQDQIRTLEQQIRVLADRSDILGNQRLFVKSMLTSATSPTTAAAGAPPPSLEEWQRLYEYSESTLGRISAELQSIDHERSGLASRLMALEQQLAQLRGAAGRSYKTVTVRISVARGGDLKLELSYAVPNASWTPAYDARVRRADRSVELGYFGVVRQVTGEDWENVTLTLSTARPSLGGGPPMLPAWVVDVAPANAPAPVAGNPPGQFTSRGFTQIMSGSNVTQSGWAPGQTFNATQYDFGRGANSVVGVSSNAEAAVSLGATSAVFKVSTPVTLASSNATQRVPITTLRSQSMLRYESTPRIREAAYLAAPAVNTSDYPLLGGPLNTFLDNSFVASGWLNPATTGERIELQLGVDDGVGIKRKVVNRFTEETGISNRNRRVTYEILITLTNFRTTPEEVRFREAVPVSRDERIVVRQITPADRDIGDPADPKAPAVVREVDGKLTWKVLLSPGEKREITLKYSVEHPADVLVTGLE